MTSSNSYVLKHSNITHIRSTPVSIPRDSKTLIIPIQNNTYIYGNYNTCMYSIKIELKLFSGNSKPSLLSFMWLTARYSSTTTCISLDASDHLLITCVAMYVYT